MPLRHPVQTAEELAVLDLISNGRLAVTFGLGWRPYEFAMFGKDINTRVGAVVSAIEVMRQAWTGNAFTFNGAAALVRPVPVHEGGPRISLAGITPASARRAAKLGTGYDPAPSYDGPSPLYLEYEAECARLGMPAPPPYMRPGPAFLFVSDDPDRDWKLLLPHLAHHRYTYASWVAEVTPGSPTYAWWVPGTETTAEVVAPSNDAEMLEEFKRDPTQAILTPERTIELAKTLGPQSELVFRPLIGGTPPDLAWRGLRTFADEVLPALRELGYVGTNAADVG